MSITKTFKFICNLCGNKEENESGVIPSGWLNMLIENPMLDRDFTEKHICVKCVNEIHTRHRKANKLDIQ